MRYIEYTTFESNVKNLGCTVTRLDINYNMSDHRCWSAIVNPGEDNVIVTFTINKYTHGSHFFDIITDDRTSFDVDIDDIYDILADLLGKNIVELDFND